MEWSWLKAPTFQLYKISSRELLYSNVTRGVNNNVLYTWNFPRDSLLSVEKRDGRRDETTEEKEERKIIKIIYIQWIYSATE